MGQDPYILDFVAAGGINVLQTHLVNSNANFTIGVMNPVCQMQGPSNHLGTLYFFVRFDIKFGVGTGEHGSVDSLDLLVAETA